MDYNSILQHIKESCTALLHENLVGIYIHGSIAFGCFDRDKSDIDYIIIVNGELSLETKNELLQETAGINKSAPPKGLEMSAVLKKHCLNFIYPTPYELHFSNTHRENTGGFDKDLTAHFTVIKKTGIVLCGEPIDSVFGDIPAEFYFDSIISDIKDAGNQINANQAYCILNLCRILAYKRNNLILSKKAGGYWGLENLGGKHSITIKAALGNAEINHDSVLEFYKYMLGLISC
ncbi:MAG: DUF4111 domain-containing protein [Oscillospiraceae bacterium]|nr:DUF4111 domain-containing protein [Oscillospiraceae bacterium]